MSKQILRSGSSIGANVEDAISGQSTKDFIHKVSIARKEARETSYRLRLLQDTGYLEVKHFESMHTDCKELKKNLNSIILTSKGMSKNSELDTRNS